MLVGKKIPLYHGHTNETHGWWGDSVCLPFSLLTSSIRKNFPLPRLSLLALVWTQWPRDLMGIEKSALEGECNSSKAIWAETLDFFLWPRYNTCQKKRLQSTLTWATFSPIFGVCSAPWKNLAEPLSCIENCDRQTQVETNSS